METVRCFCGKILCQVEGDKVYIKCRHCKRMMVLQLETVDESGEARWRIEEAFLGSATISTGRSEGRVR